MFLNKIIKLFGFLVVLLMFNINCVLGSPVRKQTPGIEVPPPKLIKFMRRFGYLEPNPSDSEALYHEVSIIEAIKNIQKYGALNQTGELDNATLNLLSSPRCGVPDIADRPTRSKRYIIGARPWYKRKISYYIANRSSKIHGEQIKNDFERAFNMWARYNRLKLQRSYNSSADIIIGFGSQNHGDNYPFDGPGNILAHAFYPYEMGAYGGDIHFDEDENWIENAPNLVDGVDFYTVILHELGHSLGLAHSPVYASIMFPYYKGPTQNILSYDDVLAMYELYVRGRIDERETVILRSTTTTTTTPREDYFTTSTIETPTTVRQDVKFTYEGDYETVSNHKHRYSTNMILKSSEQTTTTKVPKKITPDMRNSSGSFICQGSFDAVSLIKGAVYIFKGKYVWRITQRYKIASGYPKLIRDMLPFVPENLTQIDAAYERFDGAAVYFTGKQYWVYDGQRLLENSPRKITDLISTATNITKIDAAMLWPKNNFTYIFAGTQFWKLNDRLRRTDESFPKPIQRWVGIPSNIDAAATLPNGKTYFFKNNLYWLYNNKFIRPERGYPRRASTAWLGCLPKTQKTKLRNLDTKVLFI